MLKNQQKVKVVANTKAGKGLFRLSLEAASGLRKAKPGQFVHLRVADGLKPFFRRPFSVFRVGKTIDILYEVVGEGTRLLSQKRKGDFVDCLGPLGNAFDLPPRGTEQVILIAGGVGVAPLLALSDILKDKKLDVVLLSGSRTKAQVPSLKEFKQNGCVVHVSTDDGSLGAKGKVTALLSEIDTKKKTFLYACGPRPMIQAVCALAQARHLAGQASLEEVMACGVGTCLGCSIETTKGFQTVCHDGPVFDLDEMILQRSA